MRFYLQFFLLLFMVFVFTDAGAQRILLVEKPGTFRNFKYFVGDGITLRTTFSDARLEGVIHEITDSSILINFDNEIMLKHIRTIHKRRWGLSLLSKATRIAGAGYFAIDALNRTINKESPIFDTQTLLISSGLVAFSYSLVPLHYKKMKRGPKWRVRILNMSLDEEPVNPFQQ